MASPAHADSTGRILVSLDRGGRDATAAATAVLAAAGARASGPSVPQIGLVTVTPRAGVGMASALRRLRADRRVRAASREGRFELRYVPNDPALRAFEPDGGAPAGTVLQWAIERQGFTRAWDLARGEGGLVAVIDTGVDAGHPDLQGKIAEALDFDDATQEPATADADGHGTHVGSLACAGTDNGVGIAGAGFACRLLVIKTDLTDASVARAIVTAADRGVHAINMSFGDDGGSRSQPIADAIEYAVERNVVLVAAAADEPVQEQGEPANLLQPTGSAPDLAAGRGLSVTAATADDRRAGFAGHGPQISLAAYGALRTDSSTRGVFALYPGNQTPREQPSVVPPSSGCGCRAALDGDSRYAFLPGTSMSAPQVAGAAAVVRRLNPDLTALEVVKLLKETARRPAGAGWEPELGWGILDAGSAVDAAQRIDRRPPSSRARAERRTTRGRTVVLRWTATDTAAGSVLPAGVARYHLWRSIDGRPARRILATGSRSARVRIRPGRRYGFYTVAIDHAGNREAAPLRPDTSVRALRPRS